MLDSIVIKGASEHNLKNIDLTIPRNKLVVITGLSGSGKSSLAFDTLYAEGQRRYVESLSAYARQFLEQMEKPEVESIEGLSPAISIEQKSTSKNPRSTVATVTEIYDYLRLLFARVGTPHCPKCGKPITSQTVQQMADRILQYPEGEKIQLLAPIVRGRKGEYRAQLRQLAREGYTRARLDGEPLDLSGPLDIDKNKRHDIEIVVDRLVVKAGIEARLAESIEAALRLAEGLLVVERADQTTELLSEKLACIECGTGVPEMAPRLFSFNSPYGACESCHGLGTRKDISPAKLVADPNKSILGGALSLWSGPPQGYYLQMLRTLARHYGFDLGTAWKDLPKRAREVMFYGSGGEELDFRYVGDAMKYSFRRSFEGLIPTLTRRYRQTSSDKVREDFERFLSVGPCPDCGGGRLKPEARAVQLAGLSIVDVVRLSIKEAGRLFQELELPPRERQIAQRVLKEIRERLRFLEEVGLNYLTLDRASATLSGGEGQRIRLATQIGSSLTGVLYILDEPSIGLHQRDNRRLLASLFKMRDLGNTVIVVEHDEETIRCADHVIDLGPGAGRHGGEVVAQGPPEAILRNPRSLTGQYLSGKRSVPLPKRRRQPRSEAITVVGARENNLKNLTARFPLGVFTCVTGVSGSGKSTLVNEIIYKAVARQLYGALDEPGAHDSVAGLEAIDKVIDIDQSPIGRTPRSNPATYTGLFTLIRDLFTQVPEARLRGYKAGRFSFNVKGGRCEACQGDGILKIEMHFLPDVYVTCDTCKGKRYNRETLEVRYKGRNIAEVLDMTVDQALEFLSSIPPIRQKLETLRAVGLGYVHLGQSATTLSGGEAQRVKLSRELGKRSTGRTFYILDEPTTGLHFEDTRKLLEVLHTLVEQGNTVVVIEHNLDVVKTADWILDLGPEGGDEGGWIVAEGTPEQVAEIEASYTGKYLKRLLSAKAPKSTRKAIPA
jgi:excinuclease ABC subunit A